MKIEAWRSYSFCQAYLEFIQTSDNFSLVSFRNHPSPHCQQMWLGIGSMPHSDIKLRTWPKRSAHYDLWPQGLAQGQAVNPSTHWNNTTSTGTARTKACFWWTATWEETGQELWQSCCLVEGKPHRLWSQQSGSRVIRDGEEETGLSPESNQNWY